LVFYFCSQRLVNQRSVGFPIFWSWAYPMNVIPET
jgi:hypothetical protein